MRVISALDFEASADSKLALDGMLQELRWSVDEC